MNSHTLDKKNHRHELYIKKSLSQIDIYNADKSYQHGIAYSLVIDGHEIRRYVKPRLFADRFSVVGYEKESQRKQKLQLIAKLSIEYPGEHFLHERIDPERSGMRINNYIKAWLDKFYRKYIDEMIYISSELELIKSTRVIAPKDLFYISIYITIIRKYFNINNKKMGSEINIEMLNYLSRRPFYCNMLFNEYLETFNNEINFISDGFFTYEYFIYKLFSYFTEYELHTIYDNFTNLDKKYCKPRGHAQDPSEEHILSTFFKINKRKYTPLLTDHDKHELVGKAHAKEQTFVNICLFVPPFFPNEELNKYLTDKIINKNHKIFRKYSCKKENVIYNNIIYGKLWTPKSPVALAHIYYFNLLNFLYYNYFGLSLDSEKINYYSPEYIRYARILIRRPIYEQLKIKDLRYFSSLELNYDFKKLNIIIDNIENPELPNDEYIIESLKLLMKYFSYFTEIELNKFVNLYIKHIKTMYTCFNTKKSPSKKK